MYVFPDFHCKNLLFVYNDMSNQNKQKYRKHEDVT